MISFTFLQPIHHDSIVVPDIRIWLKSVISSEQKTEGELKYIFCDDNQLLDINKQFLNHDTYTDIITFPTTENEKIISGEIYISIDRVKENSELQSVTFINELKRVMVHGVLHLIGYDDHTSAEKKLMRSKEDYYLHLQR